MEDDDDKDDKDEEKKEEASEETRKRKSDPVEFYVLPSLLSADSNFRCVNKRLGLTMIDFSI